MPVYSRSNYDLEAFGERSRPDVVLFVNPQARSCLIDFGTNIPPSVFPPTKACRCLSHPMRSSATELSNRFRKLFSLKQLGGRTIQPLQKVVRSRATWWWNYPTASESCSRSSNSVVELPNRFRKLFDLEQLGAYLESVNVSALSFLHPNT